MTEPLASYRRRPAALFTDVDGTMTTDGRLRASTFAALERVARSGLPVIIVTGRPAGWGDAMIRTWPVRAAVTENGAVSFARSGPEPEAGIERLYGLPEADIAPLRTRMMEAVEAIGARFPGAALSADSRYREVDLAIDWNEDVKLERAHAEDITRYLNESGFTAVRSSVHVNFGPSGVDKLTACRAIVERVLGGDPARVDDYVYVGDALNDAPLFRGFAHSVGVANVRDVWDELPDKPRYVTDAAEGLGFEELASALLERAREESADG